jgi:hypothetical protein
VSERFDQLNMHHGNLRARCALQRLHLEQTTQEIESQLSGIDRGVSVVRRVARSPALIMGGVAIVALVGPRRVLGWATRAALFYSTAKRFLRMVR